MENWSSKTKMRRVTVPINPSGLAMVEKRKINRTESINGVLHILENQLQMINTQKV